MIQGMAIIDKAAAARAWIADLPDVSRETFAALDVYIALLRDESTRQNLVAASTLAEDILWSRHILDSAQCLAHAPGAGRWVDLGSGPGLPGLIVAILAPHMHVTLVESRRLRVAFLQRCVTEIGLNQRVNVVQARVETLPPCAYDVISARAFAPLARLIPTARHLAGTQTRWILPMGQGAKTALSTLPAPWQRCFALCPSLTDAASGLLVANGAFNETKSLKKKRN